MSGHGDYAHRQTDKALAELEQRIGEVYSEAAEGLENTIAEYFAGFQKRDAKMRALIGEEVSGRIYTEAEYKQWRLNQIGRGKRYEALRDKIAERYTNANEVALSYVNDATPSVYSLNRNFAAYQIEGVAGDVGFDLFDEQTVKRLIVEQPDLMPSYPAAKALKRGIDLDYGKQQITKVITSSILQGKSIPGIAESLMTAIPTMSRKSAVRAARTAITGAQNAGRMDSYKAAERMGIKLQKKWLATLDNRTRHEHRKLDGQVRNTDEPFEVDGYEIGFPGDPTAEGFLVYNCRCTLVSVVDGIDTSDAKRIARDPVTGKTEVIDNVTYSEWAGQKKAAGKTVQAKQATQAATAQAVKGTTFEVTDGLTDAFRAGMAKTLAASGHDEVKNVFAKYREQIKCCDNAWKETAHFSRAYGGVRFDEAKAVAGSDAEKPYQTAFHEFGHNIDWLIGGKDSLVYASNKAYNGIRLQDVIKGDYKTFKKGLGMTRNDDVIIALRDSLSLQERAYISDILEYCTNRSFPLGTGHGVAYHGEEGKTEREFFAEVLGSAAANEGAFRQMQRIFPSAVKMVFDIIGE